MNCNSNMVLVKEEHLTLQTHLKKLQQDLETFQESYDSFQQPPQQSPQPDIVAHPTNSLPDVSNTMNSGKTTVDPRQRVKNFYANRRAKVEARKARLLESASPQTLDNFEDSVLSTGSLTISEYELCCSSNSSSNSAKSPASINNCNANNNCLGKSSLSLLSTATSEERLRYSRRYQHNAGASDVSPESKVSSINKNSSGSSGAQSEVMADDEASGSSPELPPRKPAMSRHEFDQYLTHKPTPGHDTGRHNAIAGKEAGSTPESSRNAVQGHVSKYDSGNTRAELSITTRHEGGELEFTDAGDYVLLRAPDESMYSFNQQITPSILRETDVTYAGFGPQANLSISIPLRTPDNSQLVNKQSPCRFASSKDISELYTSRASIHLDISAISETSPQDKPRIVQNHPLHSTMIGSPYDKSLVTSFSDEEESTLEMICFTPQDTRDRDRMEYRPSRLHQHIPQNSFASDFSGESFSYNQQELLNSDQIPFQKQTDTKVAGKSFRSQGFYQDILNVTVTSRCDSKPTSKQSSFASRTSSFFSGDQPWSGPREGLAERSDSHSSSYLSEWVDDLSSSHSLQVNTPSPLDQLRRQEQKNGVHRLSKAETNVSLDYCQDDTLTETLDSLHATRATDAHLGDTITMEDNASKSIVYTDGSHQIGIRVGVQIKKSSSSSTQTESPESQRMAVPVNSPNVTDSGSSRPTTDTYDYADLFIPRSRSRKQHKLPPPKVNPDYLQPLYMSKQSPHRNVKPHVQASPVSVRSQQYYRSGSNSQVTAEEGRSTNERTRSRRPACKELTFQQRSNSEQHVHVQNYFSSSRESVKTSPHHLHYYQPSSSTYEDRDHSRKYHQHYPNDPHSAPQSTGSLTSRGFDRERKKAVMKKLKRFNKEVARNPADFKTLAQF